MRYTALSFVVAALAALPVPCLAIQPMADVSAFEKRVERISAADLKADAATLFRVIESVHPGLYRYNTKEQMAANVAALDAAFEHDLTREQAFLVLSQFTAKIKCDHTYLNPSNQSKAVVAELFLGQDKVPFLLPLDRWANDHHPRLQ